MATGPEHYREAERLIELARTARHSDLYGGSIAPQTAMILADALVHATLAGAAATALGTSRAETLAWAETAGFKLGGQPGQPGD